jgi:hypothetical protein
VGITCPQFVDDGEVQKETSLKIVEYIKSLHWHDEKQIEAENVIPLKKAK